MGRVVEKDGRERERKGKGADGEMNSDRRHRERGDFKLQFFRDQT